MIIMANLKQTSRALLKAILKVHRQPITVKDLAQSVPLCRRAAHEHLRILETAGLIKIDRSELPHSYEITGKGMNQANGNQ